MSPSSLSARALVASILLLTLLGRASGAESAVATFYYSDGRATETRSIPFESRDGAEILRIPVAELQGVSSVEVERPEQVATAGEDGFFVFSNGFYGTWRDIPDARYNCPHRVMSVYGVKTPRGAFATILEGLVYEAREFVEVKAGRWRVFVRYELKSVEPYEDLSIRYVPLPLDATLGDMAAAYRDYQLARGEVRPLKERAKERPELAYAVEAPEVRIRMGWKPVPSPVPEQSAENEPELKVAVTFERFEEIAEEFKRQGIDKAEFCLVGWNIGGHDGRYPQIFPPDERLGGEAKLKEAVARAQELGYQVVCHQNYSDAYRASQIGGLWDEGYLLVKPDGTFNTYTTWGGGNMYETCPKEMLKRFPKGDFPKLRELGFRGLHYIDVYSTVDPRACYSEEHPVNRREFADLTTELAKQSRDAFGGFASEGGFDYCVKYLDYALYVSFWKPGSALPAPVERVVPFWQLVYNGIVLSNPFAETMNYSIKTPADRLKFIEFGGRPSFYFYSKFRDSGTNWMGDADITCSTDEELRASVAKIKEAFDEYQKLKRLQLEYMTSHERLAENVFKTGYSNGAQIVVNYGDAPFEWNGTTVPALDYSLIEPQR